MAPLTLRLPAQCPSAETARQAVLAYLAPCGLSARLTYSLEVVLEELIMNLSLHAFDDPQGETFELQVEAEPAHIVLRLADQGRPHDPTTARPTTRPASLDEATPGGLGLVLLQRRAARMDYRRQAGWNRLTVWLDRA